MNPCLFDSSSIITLVERKKLDELLEGWTIDLAFYELGNAVWKQVHLYKTINTDDAKIVLDAFVSVFKKMRKVQEADPFNILRVATEEGLTYYDAAYLQAATVKHMTLVTDDSKLKKASTKYVKTATSHEFP
jgi:predicted nucleic acid-binding protein